MIFGHLFFIERNLNNRICNVFLHVDKLLKCEIGYSKNSTLAISHIDYGVFIDL